MSDEALKNTGKSNYSRRRFLKLAAVSMAAIPAGSALLAACGDSATPAPAAGATGGTSSSGKVELQVYVHTNHPFDNVKPLFEQKYPNVTLKMLGNNDPKVFRTILASKENVPDIFWPEVNDVQAFGKTGVLLDVTDLVNKLKDKYVPGKLAEVFIPSTGKYGAYPADVAPVGIYYREDLFKKAGVTIPDDWTWDDYIEASIKIKQATGASTMAIAPEGTDRTPPPWTFLLAQMGGSVTNADGSQVTLDDEKGIAAMKLLKKMYDAKIFYEEDPLNETFFAALSGNKIAALPMPVWYRGFAMDKNITTAEQGLGQWRVALLPRTGPNSIRTANFGGASIASTKYTQHPQEVKNFMEYAMGTMEGVTAMAKYGIMPSYLPYLESDDWKKARTPVMGDFPFNEIWTKATKEYPTTWYKQAVYAEAMTELGGAMLPMLRGQTPIESGMKAVGDRVRELNKRYQS
ncbi:MAG TPA: extracellular solute-binding protein [Chloroflexia bacterium]|nr:extracellular solute-binding protein [Chloroflexia bacterium]